MVEWFDANLVSVLNGLAIGSLLFIVALGLSLIFGMINVLNLAHGALYLVGAYIAYALLGHDATWLSLVIVTLVAGAAGAIGGVGLSLLTEPLKGRGHLPQALLTLGVGMVVAEILTIAFGNDVHAVSPPPSMAGSISVLGTKYPAYRFALILMGLIWACAAYLVIERTRLGALIRATVADRQMVQSLGIPAKRVLLSVFAFGGAFAAAAGVLGAPLFGARPGLDLRILVLALVVVVVGGMGSVVGTFISALLIGQVEAIGRALLPELASFLLFAAMVLVLVVRPQGLLGDVTRTEA